MPFALVAYAQEAFPDAPYADEAVLMVPVFYTLVLWRILRSSDALVVAYLTK